MSGATMKSVVTRSGFSCGVGRHLPRSVHLTCIVKQRARLAPPSANLAMAAPATAASVAWTTGLSENGAAMGALGAALPTALAAVLAFGLARFMQGPQQSDDDRTLPECPRCDGTGFEPCPICSRWSDGDIGCSCCRGTGRAVCSSCGGGGKAQPIRQEIHISDRDR